VSAADLTILSISRFEQFSHRFLREMAQIAAGINCQLVIGADGIGSRSICPTDVLAQANQVVPVLSKGYIESVLDIVVGHCSTPYVFRLDDDERCSDSLIKWLSEGGYRTETHWKFPRAHVWRDANTFISALPLWPDHQTRLSIKEKSGGRTGVHAGSPYGGGTPCPWHIEHWKFMVKSFDERQHIASVYDHYQQGYGTGGMLAFNLPELAIPNLLETLQPLRDIEP
jgi:hypothetical protein